MMTLGLYLYNRTRKLVDLETGEIIAEGDGVNDTLVRLDYEQNEYTLRLI